MTKGLKKKNEITANIKVGEEGDAQNWSVTIPIEGKEMSVSEQIIEKIKQDGARFHANDNISKYINDEERALLLNEVTDKFDAVLRSLVIDVDSDPNSKGTAKRLAKMYINELMSGRYFPDPDVTAFPNDGSHGTKEYKGMLTIRAELKSMCSHHHQIVSGVAYIGIIPGSKVIGLSKYVRIAQHCARRGTLQEELCNDIALEIMKATDSENVAVHIAAEHGCCTNRGVMAASSLTQTTVLHGMFYINSVKTEFFDNIKLQSSQSKYSCV
jgi:GTP cyclohydrolase IA